MKHRVFSFLIVLVLYILAATLGLLVFHLTGGSIYWRVFLADVAATLLVWLAGVFLKTASVYDPYWSVAPMVILPLVVGYYGQWNSGVFLLLLVVFFWGMRLTLNWAYTFHGLSKQDWRYTMLHDQQPKLYFLTNLIGINFVPTIIVYLALLPGIVLIQSFSSLNIWTMLAALVCVLAALIQLVSDIQLHRFRTQKPGQIIRTGLWKYSRHPNYLGEVTMWWGVWLMLLSVSLSFWPYALGAMCNTLLFVFVSIPMMEKRQQHKPGYAQYCRETGMLLPILGRSKRKMVEECET